MSESIRLPRSGVVLTGPDPCNGLPHFYKSTSILYVEMGVGHDDRSHYTVWAASYAPFRGTREECVEWLDARVLDLRRALMPADLRERVARELDSWGPLYDLQLEVTTGDDLADAVLAELGLGDR